MHGSWATPEGSYRFNPQLEQGQQRRVIGNWYSWQLLMAVWDIVNIGQLSLKSEVGGSCSKGTFATNLTDIFLMDFSKCDSLPLRDNLLIM